MKKLLEKGPREINNTHLSTEDVQYFGTCAMHIHSQFTSFGSLRLSAKRKEPLQKTQRRVLLLRSFRRRPE